MDLNELKLTPKRKEICQKLGLNDSDDILSYYPFRYENYQITPYDSFTEGGNVFFEAEILTYPSTFRYGKRSTTKFKVLYEDEEIAITIFNRPWLRGLEIGDKITIAGKYEGHNKVMANQYYLKDIEEMKGLVPVYSTSEGISQNDIKKIIQFTYQKCVDVIKDKIPDKYLDAHRLIDKRTAISNIHFPKNEMLLKMSLARLKYEEFLRFYVALNIIKDSGQKLKKPKDFSLDKVNEFIRTIGFPLTADQLTTCKDIVKDLSSSKIMYRLVQGDVGSGKTAVAMVAFYANYLAGYQGALMAPTEILARQHYETFKELFANCNVVLLTGSIKDAKEVKAKIEDGGADIIIGTHALFSDDVKFGKLGLVVADEQQRFGVKQRKKLKDKGEDVDFLMMSATPIPRTLASSVYGDMDVSTIETMPVGRKGCDTYLIKENSIKTIIPDILNTLKQGRQIYVIAAAIEHNDNFAAKDVIKLTSSISDVLKDYNVFYLHGQMSDEEKNNIMGDFYSGKIDVLVSTTVVEVGVNVKNATMMIVYDADRFGMSQLHQLRGRIQRGNHKGTCYLLTGSKDKEVEKRLNILCQTNSGFEISLFDLKLRGPGDMLGTRQSGLPPLILGNLVEDTKIINGARADADEICNFHDDMQSKAFFDEIREVASKKYID